MDSHPMRMNWGCGPIVADGWVNVDNASGHPLVYRSTKPFPDGQFDGIVANHSLQCLTHDELDPMVRELARVLRPEGRLRVLVPDVLAAFYSYTDEEPKIGSDWPGFRAITENWSLDRKFAHYLTWGGSNRSCFTHLSLIELFERHGFRQVTWIDPEDESWTWLRMLDSRLGESIMVEMVKP